MAETLARTGWIEGETQIISPAQRSERDVRRGRRRFKPAYNFPVR